MSENDDLPLFTAAAARERRAGLQPVACPPPQPAPRKPRAPRRKPQAISWSASVTPFPLIRRRDFIARHATRMAELPEPAAEKHLATQLDIQRKAMERRSIAPDVIERELSSMAGAVRAALIRIIGSEGGAA